MTPNSYLPLTPAEIAELSRLLEVSESLIRLRQNDGMVLALLHSRLKDGPKKDVWIDAFRPDRRGPQGCPVSDDQLRALLFFPATGSESILSSLRQNAEPHRTPSAAVPPRGAAPTSDPIIRPVETIPTPPSILERVNDALGWFYRGLFRLALFVLLSPWYLLRSAASPRQTWQTVSPWLRHPPIRLGVVAVLTVVGGVLLWRLLSLPDAHAPRLLAVTALCFALVEAVRPRDGRPLRARLLWLAGGGLAALACWLLIPTTDGYNLLWAEWRSRRLAGRLDAAPARDPVSEILDADEEGEKLAAAFPHVRRRVGDAERAWCARWGEAVGAEVRPVARRDLAAGLGLLRARRKSLNERLGGRAPGVGVMLRRELFRLRLEAYAWELLPLVKADRFQAAARRVARLTAEDEPEARELGMLRELNACRDRYGYLADLARLAGKTDPN